MVMALVSAFQAVLPHLLPLLLHALQLPHLAVVILWQNFYLAFIIHVFSSFFLPHIVCKCVCVWWSVSQCLWSRWGVGILRTSKWTLYQAWKLLRLLTVFLVLSLCSPCCLLFCLCLITVWFYFCVCLHTFNCKLPSHPPLSLSESGTHV